MNFDSAFMIGSAILCSGIFLGTGLRAIAEAIRECKTYTVIVHSEKLEGK